MNILNSKRNQLLLGIFIIVFLALSILFINYKLFTSLIFGVLFGFTLQRSRFCFVSAFRDPLLIGNSKVTNALLLSLAIMTVTFPIIQYIQLDRIGTLVGNVYPVGIHTVVGALLFGFGMVIAGGCASGTLMRVGEGSMMQLLVLVGFLIGTLLGAGNFEWWHRKFIANSPTIFLPDTMGWLGAVVFQLSFLFVVYCLIKYVSKRKKIL